MVNGRILLADNEPMFRMARARFLRTRHYHVLEAGSVAEAEKVLSDEWVHLAILDIRLEDDRDEKDVSGLLLAKKADYRSLPKIMLTGHPSYEAARQALGPVFDGLPPAVAFLAKAEGLEAMIKAVEEAFAQHVRINRDLVLQTSPTAPIALPHLVSLIMPDGDASHLRARTEELEDLLRHLFFAQQQITLARLLWQRPGRVALVVLAFQAGALPDAFVVVCGQTQDMADTARRYSTFAPKIPGETGTVPSLSAETTHFAAQAYALAGVDLEQVQSLASLYRTAPEKICHTALERLVQQTIAAWHQDKRARDDTRTLDAIYRTRLQWEQRALSPAAFAERVQALLHQLPTLGVRMTHTESGLTLSVYGQTFPYPDPLPFLYRPSSIGQPVLLMQTPGFLSGETILADGNDRTWLTDFAEAGLAPVLWTFVSLEALIRFDWVESGDMQALHDMERCLVHSPFLQIDTRDLEPGLRKPVRAIQALRRLAAPLLENDPTPYHFGLLFHAADRLSRLNPALQLSKSELVRLGHALLAAAMLCGQLAPETPVQATAHTTDHPQGLRIDLANHAVWVNGVRLVLTGQSYRLLCYLYTHANQLCTRRELIESVFEQAYDDTDISQIGRLNTAIRRLREKIEEEPGQPRYLLTEPGGGYRLLGPHTTS